MSLMIDRFLLSRLESLCESFKSSEGGQRRDCVLCSVPLSLHSANPTDSPDARISGGASVVLSDCCTSGGKTLISRINLCPSATCRGLRPCLLWHLWPVSASAHADAKTVPKHHRPRMTDVRPKAPADSDRHHTPGRSYRRHKFICHD